MTPLQDIRFPDPMTPQQREAALFEMRQTRGFQAVIEYLREESFTALGDSLKHKRKGKDDEAALSLGGFDLLSQATVKLYAASRIAPKVEE